MERLAGTFCREPRQAPLSEYAGAYESQLYGRLRINVETDMLQIRFGTRFLGGRQRLTPTETRQ
jgi:hypothetical protein